MRGWGLPGWWQLLVIVWFRMNLILLLILESLDIHSYSVHQIVYGVLKSEDGYGWRHHIQEVMRLLILFT